MDRIRIYEICDARSTRAGATVYGPSSGFSGFAATNGECEGSTPSWTTFNRMNE